MLDRYTQIVHIPTPISPLTLTRKRRIKWGQVFRDIKGAIDSIVDAVRDAIEPTPNPFDLAMAEVLDQLLFEA